ncbi:PREDICTED: uncharacterized protein LOC108973008 [Bactrocera latifrons]|uniref:uncharacterized protein LOC108973008 n=1 Tax=Bactrocera latifrons TaxID=174628 RepID=UPI0008DDF60E|nr:PREDICTED: uncharacterized protein LOC108973008 [Bactrocera latifrons]
MELAQVNLHHASAASAVIVKRFISDNLSILLIQEPWVFKGEVRGLNSKRSKVIWVLSSERPRSCVVVRADIDFFCISEFLTQDLVAVQVKDKEGLDFVLASAYFPGETATVPTPSILSLVEYCRRNNLPPTLGCDANAHHTEWGSTDCNVRGDSLLEFIISNNMSIENVGCEPTFVTSVRREVLDIILSNDNMIGLISQWRVSNEPPVALFALMNGRLGEGFQLRYPKF